jgi:ElaB/YqjD/DUF883 family membrane-anchored ribosome-binding protein
MKKNGKKEFKNVQKDLIQAVSNEAENENIILKENANEMISGIKEGFHEFKKEQRQSGGPGAKDNIAAARQDKKDMIKDIRKGVDDVKNEIKEEKKSLIDDIKNADIIIEENPDCGC